MMTEAHLTAPTFESNRGANTFTIRLLLHHFLGEEDLKWLTRFDRYGLDDNQKKALIFLREAGAVNNLVFRQLSGVDTLHASSALREMRDAGIIIQKGAGNATYYVPGEIIWCKEGETLQASGETLQASGETLQVQAENLSRLPEIKKLTDNIKKHIPRADFEKILCALCQGRELEAPLIARLIRRNETYVRTFLTRLVACKRLQYKYPEMPTHPHQAYTAAKQG